MSLGSICNWLVMMPWDKIDAIPRYFSRSSSCQHHSFISLLDAKPPEEEELQEYGKKKRYLFVVGVLNSFRFLFHLSKQYGAHFRRPLPPKSYRDRILPDRQFYPRRSCVLALSPNGCVGLEWGGVAPSRSFGRHFFGLLLVLQRHCLAEHTMLTKLSYLAAWRSQGLHAALGSVTETEKMRFMLLRLSSFLVHYRTSMMSDDCGGMAETRTFFKVLCFFFFPLSFFFEGYCVPVVC